MKKLKINAEKIQFSGAASTGMMGAKSQNTQAKPQQKLIQNSGQELLQKPVTKPVQKPVQSGSSLRAIEQAFNDDWANQAVNEKLDTSSNTLNVRDLKVLFNGE